MPTDRTAGKPTTSRYSDEEKQAAVRMVRSLQAETGTAHGAVQRVAEQLGMGSSRSGAWVTQAEIDEGVRPGTHDRVRRSGCGSLSRRTGSCAARTRS